MMTKFHLSLLVGLLACGSYASAGTIALLPSQDNTIYGPNTGGNSFGEGQHLFAGGYRQSRALIAFDFSGIPSGATIESVSLVMYMDRANAWTGGSETYDMFLHKLTASWGEGTSKWMLGGDGQVADLGIRGGGGPGSAATNGDVTWTYRHYNITNPTASPAWDTPGGDYVAQASAMTQVGHGMSTSGMEPMECTWTSDMMVADVQGWLDDPTGNFGWLLESDQTNPSNNNPRRFISAENYFNGENPLMLYDASGTIVYDGRLTPDLRPYLYVTYSIPEPVSICSLALGVIVLFRRRPAYPLNHLNGEI